MKLGVTADLHLTTQEAAPTLYQTLAALLAQCGRLNLEVLFIAGDLFDRQQSNLADFEAVLQEHRPPDLEIVILPGNHDPHLTSGAFTADGVRVIVEPKLLQLSDQLDLLLVPYRSASTMGEQLAEFQDRLVPGRWLLISHADWLGGNREVSANEPGVYLPLTQRDLSLFQPLHCLLGHVHRPSDNAPVHYAGSPCPLDITETGGRRLLVFDSTSEELSSEPVDSPTIYFNERIVMLPVSDESQYLAEKLEAMQSSWHLAKDKRERIQLRLRLTGYASDRAELKGVIDSKLSDIDFYPGSPDFSGLKLATDPDRSAIARRTAAVIESMVISTEEVVDRQEILEQALAVIYGG